MSYVNLTENGCVGAKPTVAYLADRMENRRFMLVSLAGFSLFAYLAGFVGNFSGAANVTATINMFARMLQSLI